MSNKSVKVKVRILGLVEEIRDKSDANQRPGTNKGSQKNVMIQIPQFQLPADEWAQRLADAAEVLQYGNDLDNDRPPVAITDGVTLVTQTTARLHGTTRNCGIETALRFEFGLVPNLDGNQALYTPDSSPITSVVPTSEYVDMAGLDPDTQYWYRFRTGNSNGTKYGVTKSFRTLPNPV
jgi:hypothetical protein